MAAPNSSRARLIVKQVVSDERYVVADADFSCADSVFPRFRLSVPHHVLAAACALRDSGTDAEQDELTELGNALFAQFPDPVQAQLCKLRGAALEIDLNKARDLQCLPWRALGNGRFAHAQNDLYSIVLVPTLRHSDVSPADEFEPGPVLVLFSTVSPESPDERSSTSDVRRLLESLDQSGVEFRVAACTDELADDRWTYRVDHQIHNESELRKLLRQRKYRFIQICGAADERGRIRFDDVAVPFQVSAKKFAEWIRMGRRRIVVWGLCRGGDHITPLLRVGVGHVLTFGGKVPFAAITVFSAALWAKVWSTGRVLPGIREGHRHLEVELFGSFVFFCGLIDWWTSDVDDAVLRSPDRLELARHRAQMIERVDQFGMASDGGLRQVFDQHHKLWVFEQSRGGVRRAPIARFVVGLALDGDLPFYVHADPDKDSGMERVLGMVEQRDRTTSDDAFGRLLERDARNKLVFIVDGCHRNSDSAWQLLTGLHARFPNAWVIAACKDTRSWTPPPGFRVLDNPPEAESSLRFRPTFGRACSWFLAAGAATAALLMALLVLGIVWFAQAPTADSSEAVNVFDDTSVVDEPDSVALTVVADESNLQLESMPAEAVDELRDSATRDEGELLRRFFRSGNRGVFLALRNKIKPARNAFTRALEAVASSGLPEWLAINAAINRAWTWVHDEAWARAIDDLSHALALIDASVDLPAPPQLVDSVLAALNACDVQDTDKAWLAINDARANLGDLGELAFNTAPL